MLDHQRTQRTSITTHCSIADNRGPNSAQTGLYVRRNHLRLDHFPQTQCLTAIRVDDLSVRSEDRKDRTLYHALFAANVEHQGRVVDNCRYLAFDFRTHLQAPKRDTGLQ